MIILKGSASISDHVSVFDSVWCRKYFRMKNPMAGSYTTGMGPALHRYLSFMRRLF